MTVTVLVGNPKAQSRTLGVAVAVAAALRTVLGETSDPLVIDLIDLASELFDWQSARVNATLQAVAHSDVVIVATPTYKATYTGLLKVFLDRYGNNGLLGTVCVPVMTGAAPIHAMAPEVHLRPLLVELGASVPTRGLYVTEDQFERLDSVIGAWLETAGPLLRRSAPAR